MYVYILGDNVDVYFRFHIESDDPMVAFNSIVSHLFHYKLKLLKIDCNENIALIFYCVDQMFSFIYYLNPFSSEFSICSGICPVLSDESGKYVTIYG